jgi:hypothetical protein
MMAASGTDNGELGGAGRSTDVSERLRAAAQTAEYLVELLRALEHDVATSQARTAESEDRGRELAELRDSVLQAALDGLNPDDLQAMRELVEALARKPSDLLVMVKISEQAEQMAAIIRSHQRVLAIVQENPSPPTPLSQGERGD